MIALLVDALKQSKKDMDTQAWTMPPVGAMPTLVVGMLRA